MTKEFCPKDIYRNFINRKQQNRFNLHIWNMFLFLFCILKSVEVVGLLNLINIEKLTVFLEFAMKGPTFPNFFKDSLYELLKLLGIKYIKL